MSKNYNLTENPSFCMLGLLHTYISPDGNVMPCCVGDMTKEPLGNINTVSDWNEIWNGEKYKQFRRNMLKGEKNPICSFCYDTEKFATSSRNWRNSQYESDYDFYVSKLSETGELATDQLKYLDFRFSNNCNQACITCGHALSSSWYDLLKKLDLPVNSPKFIEPQNKKIAYDLIDNNLNSVTNIYFAGGEPMLSEYHWYTLEKLVENGRCKEIDLTYSTNCSTLKYKNKNVLDYWKQFKSVVIMASIDEVGDRFNYIRWPGNWDNISSNLKKIKDSFEELNTSTNVTHKLCYSPVLSSLNIHRLKEIILEFIEKDIIQESNKHHPTFEYFLFNNLLRTPRHLSIINMPENHWQYVDKSLTEFEEWYIETVIKDSPAVLFKQYTVASSMEKIRKMRNMNQQDMDFFDHDTDNYLKFMREYSKMDNIRNTNFRETFPELDWLYE